MRAASPYMSYSIRASGQQCQRIPTSPELRRSNVYDAIFRNCFHEVHTGTVFSDPIFQAHHAKVSPVRHLAQLEGENFGSSIPLLCHGSPLLDD